ncbi:MAG: DNA polymerase III subunit gamma/tau [Moorea sp. SIO2B7]|nr:DNA polymerase III subunit gamma/tau [Moorena sp. SIO2B7]
MSYKPLHHKYRPQTFAELVGQEAIATTLTNAIVNQKIAPAYLFTGPRGTGKTSSARILAKSLNCLKSNKPTSTPCGECEVCRAIARGSALDVIEIDAASNTGVDNIREIIERAQFAPVQCRYKVYVIDECHMLSTPAFNALLKTLEEPPERIVFVLATTDPQRVLSTIISRCQRFDYRRIPLEAMVSHLKDIANKENINIDPEAITLVAQIANGGLRDAESLLDQLSLLSGTITVEGVWDLVGAVPEQDLMALLRAIHANNPERLIEQCRHLMNRGREPLIVLQNLANFYLNLLIAKTAPNRADLVAVTASTWKQLSQEASQWQTNLILRGQQHLKDSEVHIKNTTQPRLWLEVTLLGLLPSAQTAPIAPQEPTVSQRVASPSSDKASHIPPRQSQVQPPQPTKQASKSELPQPKTEPLQPQPQLQPQQPIPEPVKETSETASLASDTEQVSLSQLWQEVINHIQVNMTQVLSRTHCHLISIEGSVAHVGIKSEPLSKMLARNLADLEAAFEVVCKRKITVKLKVANAPNSSENSGKPSNKQQIQPREKTISRETITDKPVSSPVNKPTAPQQSISEPSSISDDSISQYPEEPISLENNKGKVSTNSSEGNLPKAAKSLKEYFKGEIITLTDEINYGQIEVIEPLKSEIEASKNSDKTADEIHTISQDSVEGNIESELKLIQEEPQQKKEPLLKNRPYLTYDNPDDIPF